MSSDVTGDQVRGYTVSWPIEDSRVPPEELVRQANLDLPRLAAALGVELVEGEDPVFSRLDDAFPPRLLATATVRVVSPAKVHARRRKDISAVRRLLAAGVQPEEIRRKTLLHPPYVDHIIAAAIGTHTPAHPDRRSA